MAQPWWPTLMPMLTLPPVLFPNEPWLVTDPQGENAWPCRWPLAAFRLSRDPMWLQRAVVFGTCIGDDGVCARQRTPDNPFSLFEGLAGSACFLRDLRESRFFGAGLPLYEVDVV